MVHEMFHRWDFISVTAFIHRTSNGELPLYNIYFVRHWLSIPYDLHEEHQFHGFFQTVHLVIDLVKFFFLVKLSGIRFPLIP